MWISQNKGFWPFHNLATSCDGIQYKLEVLNFVLWNVLLVMSLTLLSKTAIVARQPHRKCKKPQHLSARGSWWNCPNANLVKSNTFHFYCWSWLWARLPTGVKGKRKWTRHLQQVQLELILPKLKAETQKSWIKISINCYSRP